MFSCLSRSLTSLPETLRLALNSPTAAIAASTALNPSLHAFKRNEAGSRSAIFRVGVSQGKIDKQHQVRHSVIPPSHSRAIPVVSTPCCSTPQPCDIPQPWEMLACSSGCSSTAAISEQLTVADAFPSNTLCGEEKRGQFALQGPNMRCIICPLRDSVRQLSLHENKRAPARGQPRHA